MSYHANVSAVLYFEVDVWSGIGDRSAIVWHKGEAAYGPTWGTSQVAEAFRLFGQTEGLLMLEDQPVDETSA